MPELPEVETIVRRFRPCLVGAVIEAFESRWPPQVSPSVAAVQAAVAGRRIESLGRRGKYAVLGLEGGARLLLHFKMSGRLACGRPDESEPRFARAVWRFAGGGRLFLCDARKFARIRLAADAPAELACLGPEPLEPAFTPAVLKRALAGRRRALKGALLDQAVVAGLGNIYTDEALFRARLHPLRPAGSLTGPGLARLHLAIQSVLAEAIEHQGASLDWVYEGGEMQNRLLVYGRAGQPCRACGTQLERARVGQRSTVYCPNCQPRRRR